MSLTLKQNKKKKKKERKRKTGKIPWERVKELSYTVIDFSLWREVNLTKQGEDIKDIRVLKMYYMMLIFLKFFHLIPLNDLVFKKMLICMHTKAF